jgi:oligoribonuclease (3'-5' exoribonuclease)
MSKLIYMDLEFTGLQQQTVLISLGLVADTGETFYAENLGFSCPEHFASFDDARFFEENIKPSLMFYGTKATTVEREGRSYRVAGQPYLIRSSLEEWFQKLSGTAVPPDDSFQIVGDVCTYDWVVFCNLWKHALSVPSYIYYIPFDIATMMPMCGYHSDTSRESLIEETVNGSKHNALYDAQVIRLIHKRLQDDYARNHSTSDGILYNVMEVHVDPDSRNV